MAKIKTRDELKASIASTKEERKVAFEELREFEKTNKLAKNEDHSKDAKLGKKWQKLKDMHTKKKSAVEALETELSALKKEGGNRATVYTYPKNEAGKDMDAAEKKRYRAKQRALKAKGDKPAKEASVTTADKKDKKKAKTPETPAPAATPAKKKKSKPKEAPAKEEGDKASEGTDSED